LGKETRLGKDFHSLAQVSIQVTQLTGDVCSQHEACLPHAMCNFLRKDNGFSLKWLKMLFSKLPDVVDTEKLHGTFTSIWAIDRKFEQRAIS